MANVYQIQGNYKEAIVNMLEAAKNVDTTQYLYIKVEMYHNIAQLYRQVHEPAKASHLPRAPWIGPTKTPIIRRTW